MSTLWARGTRGVSNLNPNPNPNPNPSPNPTPNPKPNPNQELGACRARPAPSDEPAAWRELEHVGGEHALVAGHPFTVQPTPDSRVEPLAGDGGGRAVAARCRQASRRAQRRALAAAAAGTPNPTLTLTLTVTLTLTLTVTLTLTRTLTRALAGMAGATRTPNTCATANAASARWATRAAKGRRRRCAAHSLTQPQPEP